MERRHCRFNSESNLTHYQIYTRGLCLQECRLNLVHKLCHCIPHFYPNRSMIATILAYAMTHIILILLFSVHKPKRVCHYQELIDCVAKYTHFLIEFHDEHGRNEEAAHCYCEQNCIYSNIFIDFYQVLAGSTDLLGTIGGLAIVNQYPLIRYKRKILFSLNDLFGELFEC